MEAKTCVAGRLQICCGVTVTEAHKAVASIQSKGWGLALRPGEIESLGVMTSHMDLQGIVGSIPWSGMVFLTLYFQLLGMSDFAASLQMALLLGSTALGGLLGGWIGDRAAMKYPDHGRILVCQFSVAVGIPFSLTITKVWTDAVLFSLMLKEFQVGCGACFLCVMHFCL